MRAYELRDDFGLDHLVLTERASPPVGPGQVRVRVKAASLNYRDLSMIRGTYNPRLRLPLIPVSDGAGEVVEVGPGVTRVKVGDRVLGHFAQNWIHGPVPRDASVHKHALGGPLDGFLAEEVVLSGEGVVHVPEHMSFEEAATLPVAALTAWGALVTMGKLAAGETVLLQGTGGVSIFALQIAKLTGARVIITSSSHEKLARARQLGADETINYRDVPEWAKEVRRLTDGVGADHVVEVGGAGTMTQSLRAVRAGGTVSVIGVLAGASSEISVIPVLMHYLRLQGVFAGSRDELEAMNRAFGQAQLRPVIDRVFAFEEAHLAFEHMASGAHFSKIVLRVG